MARLSTLVSSRALRAALMILPLWLSGCADDKKIDPPPAATFDLVVSLTGSGSVTSSPAGIDCGSDCSETLAAGSNLTLSATPANGFTFSGWSRDCNGSTTSCALTLDANRAVTATFTTTPVPPPGQFTLTVSVTGSGSGSVSSTPPGINCGSDCTENYTDSTNVTLTASPETNQQFSGWLGACSGTATTCVLAMTQARNVTATFVPIPATQFTLSVSVTGTGSVSRMPVGISCGADCTASYASGTSVTLTATPGIGFQFSSWSGACSGSGACVVAMSANRTVTATFSNSGGGASVKAFPGAEGFGASATGGRGGQVLKVTNLNASGPGSLKAALDTAGPRIVVFAVSGVIDSDVYIPHGNLTIAGQTAPGGGITIRGRLFSNYSPGIDNIIIRHLRVRPRPYTAAEGAPDQYDAMQFSLNRLAIFDHISVAFGVDETFDLYEADDVTVQYSTIEQSSTLGPPSHNYGLINGPDGFRISVHHNLFAHNSNRNPAIANGPADVRNNVSYNVKHGFVHHNPATGRFNIIGNYYKQGPTDSLHPFFFDDENGGVAPDLRYYLRDNYIDDPGDYVGSVENPWATPLLHPTFSSLGLPESPYRVTTEHDFSAYSGYVAVTTETATAAYDTVLNKAGAWPRDIVTNKSVQDARDRTGSWGANVPTITGLMTGLTPTPPPVDTDIDGMADTWETARGLNPLNGSDHSTIMPSGYTAIEDYINELADLLSPGGAGAATEIPTTAGTSELFRYPYLQTGAARQMKILWATASSGACAVQYKLSTDTVWTTQSICSEQLFAGTATGLGTNYYQHEVVLDNLQPNARYTYNVLHNTAVLARNINFTTLKEDVAATTQFIVIGDSGIPYSTPRDIRNTIAGKDGGGNYLYPHDFVVGVGDIAYYNGLYTEFDNNFFGQLSGKNDGAGLNSILATRAFFPVLGNHEYGQNPNNVPAAYLNSFSLPVPAGVVAADAERYYSFDSGNAHLVVIDSEVFENGATPADRITRMLAWLDADLAATTKTWRIAFLHRTIFSSANHGTWGDYTQNNRMRKQLAPVLQNHGVQLVMFGHDHAYQRSKRLRVDGNGKIVRDGSNNVVDSNAGIVYVLSGIGGADLHGCQADPNALFGSAKYNNYVSQYGDGYDFVATRNGAPVLFSAGGTECTGLPTTPLVDDRYGFTQVTITGSTLSATTYNFNGVVMDQFSIPAN